MDGMPYTLVPPEFYRKSSSSSSLPKEETRRFSVSRNVRMSKGRERGELKREERRETWRKWSPGKHKSDLARNYRQIHKDKEFSSTQFNQNKSVCLNHIYLKTIIGVDGNFGHFPPLLPPFSPLLLPLPHFVFLLFPLLPRCRYILTLP